jgi:hypothetical protein
VPQPNNLVKVTVQFDLTDASSVVEDHAEIGIWGQLPDWDGSNADAVLEALATYAAGQWVADISPTRYSPAVVLNGVVAGSYNTAGNLTAEQKFTNSPSDWVGAASQSMPWAVSPVVSLYTYQRGTFVLQGKSKRGRVYLPPVGTTAMGNAVSGEMSVTNAEDFRDDIATWLAAIVGHSLPGGFAFHPGVLSKTHNYFNQLAYLSVDTKLDTQRRRERQQLATISTVPWP